MSCGAPRKGTRVTIAAAASCVLSRDRNKFLGTYSSRTGLKRRRGRGVVYCEFTIMKRRVFATQFTISEASQGGTGGGGGM